MRSGLNGRIGTLLRRRRLRRHALPDSDWEAVCDRLPLLARLSAPAYERLRETATLFLADKIISGATGFEPNRQQRIEIAIGAALPVLGLGLRPYRCFHGVIVYPDAFLAPREDLDEAGVMHTGHEEVAGESWDAGPILLSWADVETSRVPENAYHVVIHECAHKLDLGDGEVNGVPGLRGSGISTTEWQAVMSQAWETVQKEEKTFGAPSIDDYALESPAEFFAVISEYFFTVPQHLEASLPDAFALLRRFYRFEPTEGRLLDGA